MFEQSWNVKISGWLEGRSKEIADKNNTCWTFPYLASQDAIEVMFSFAASARKGLRHTCQSLLEPGPLLHGDVEGMDEAAPRVALVHPRCSRVH